MKYSLRKIKWIFDYVKQYKDDEMFGELYNHLFPTWLIENMSKSSNKKVIRYILHNEGNGEDMINVKSSFDPLRYKLLLFRTGVNVEEYNKL